MTTVFRFRSGLIAQTYDAFTIRNADTGLEVHGTEGSLIERDVMTWRPTGRVFLHTMVSYARCLERRNSLSSVTIPMSAPLLLSTPPLEVADGPSASGEDGVRSLAAAEAALEAARIGQTIAINPSSTATLARN